MTGAGFGLGLAYANCQNDVNATITSQLQSVSSKASDKAAKH